MSSTARIAVEMVKCKDISRYGKSMQDANTDLCMPAEISSNERDFPSSRLDDGNSRVFGTKMSVGIGRQSQTSVGRNNSGSAVDVF